MKEIYIKNANGDLEKVMVSDEVAELLETFRREDESEKRRLRRRIKQHGGPDISYEEWMGSYEFEDRLINEITIKEAIDSLSSNQKSRLIKYYILGYTYREIAKMEGKAHQTIRENIAASIKIIKKFLT